MVSPEITIVWPPTGRGVFYAPYSAVSAVIDATGEKDAIHMVVNRKDLSGKESADTFTSPVKVYLGTFDVTVRYYSDFGGAGTLVATGSGRGPVKTDAFDPSRSYLDVTIFPDGPVKTIEVANARITRDQKLNLVAVAKDKDGKILDIPQKAFTWGVGSNGFSIIDGALVPNTFGTTQVIAYFAGVQGKGLVEVVPVEVGIEKTEIYRSMDTTLAAYGTDPSGKKYPVTNSVAFTQLSGKEFFTVGPTGYIDSPKMGAGRVYVTVMGVRSPEIEIKCITPAVSVAISPLRTIRWETEGSLYFIVTWYDGRKSEVSYNGSVWTILDGHDKVVKNPVTGKYYGVKDGVVRMKVVYEGLEAVGDIPISRNILWDGGLEGLPEWTIQNRTWDSVGRTGNGVGIRAHSESSGGIVRDGAEVKANTDYRVSFWVRSVEYATVSITLSDSTPLTDLHEVKREGNWVQYEQKFRTSTNMAYFRINLNSPLLWPAWGSAVFDDVVMEKI